MSIVVNTNVASMNAQRSLATSARELQTAMERLSSGRKINSAADDAAGFAIAERMTAQVRGLNMATKNVNDAISLVSVVDNATAQISEILQRINELSIQAANGTNRTADIALIGEEITALVDEIDRIATDTSFNNEKVFFGAEKINRIQVGINDGDYIELNHHNPLSIGVWGGVSGQPSLYSDFNNHLGPIALPVSPISGADFEILSQSGTATIDIVEGDSALDAAQKINQEFDSTGVFARASTSLYLRTDHQDSRQLSLNLNGASTGVFSWSSDFSDLKEAETAINRISGETGVVAIEDDDRLMLVSHAGLDINIQIENEIEGDAFDVGRLSIYTEPVFSLTSDPGQDSATITGFIQLMSDNNFSISSSSEEVSEFFDGLTLSAVGSHESESLWLENLTTQDELFSSSVLGHTHNLRYVDVTHSPNLVSAIAQAGISDLNSERAQYGAKINRLEYTLSNLMNVAEFTSAARSRIQDTDFAVESANLAKAQVLQQTGTAILAQANAAPQLVLSLIK